MALNNYVEMTVDHKAVPGPKHIAWLKAISEQTVNPAEGAKAALCLGLLEHDAHQKTGSLSAR